MQLYKSSFTGWNVAHFHSKYRAEFAGARNYSWLKSVLQRAGVVKACKFRGKHRIKRERMPLVGMMIHQDASTHRWVPNAVWDLVVTMDDATREHTSMFFCDQEGTHHRAFMESARPLPARVCLRLCTRTGVAAPSSPQRRAVRS